MSIYHLTVKMHSRAKNKKLHALRALAYRTGSRIVDPVTLHIYDSTSKSREVKRRPHRLADALRAVPPLRRAFFEELVRDALVGTVREPNHAQAARALSAFQQLELQAKWAVEQVLTPQQLADFEYRRSCCQRLGSTYTWQTFQADINRLSGSHQGWQRAWWDELAEQFTPTVLESISALCPAWYDRSFEQWTAVSKTESQVTQQPGDQRRAQDFRGVAGVSHTDDDLQTRMNTGFGVPT